MQEIITERVTEFKEDMIKDNSVDTLVLPDSIKIIADDAFMHCPYLKKIIFVDENGNEVNNKIKEIGNYAFSNTKIEEFIYSHHLHKVGYNAFSNTPLSVFQYQDDPGVESELIEIKDSAFRNTKIKDMVIPPSLKEIVIYQDWSSLLCKDSMGNIVPNHCDYSVGFNVFSDFQLEEISLLGKSLVDVQEILDIFRYLKKVHLSAETFYMGNGLRLTLNWGSDSIEFVLYGEIEELDCLVCYINALLYLTATVNLDYIKVKKIRKYFFDNISNTTLRIPEGVEEIEGFPQHVLNFERLELPSTLKTISIPLLKGDINQERNIKTTVIVYENIPEDCYKNLCSYLEPTSSKIIIKGNNFTWRKKQYFKKISPSKVKLKFENDYQFKSNEQPILEKKDNHSVYQTPVDEVTQEILTLIHLLPDDLQLKVKERYNQIIEEYWENRKREEESIRSDRLLLGIDPSMDLYTKLLSLKHEILYNQDALSKLQEIEACKNLLDSSLEQEDSYGNDIQKNIQNIMTKCSGLSEIYISQIKNRIQELLSITEEKYKKEMSGIFGNESSVFASELDFMKELEKKLQILLEILENPLVKECMSVELAVCEESTSLDIKSLSDHIKTLNYAIRNISDREQEKKEQWETLKKNYHELFLEKILAIIQEQETVESLESLKKQFLKDLKSLVDSILLISDSDFYCTGKIEEVQNIYNFLIDYKEDKERKETVSSLFMLDLMKLIPNLSEDDLTSLQTLINEKVNDTMNQLTLADSRKEIDDIMKQFHKFLIDQMVSTYHMINYHNSEIIVKKI